MDSTVPLIPLPRSGVIAFVVLAVMGLIIWRLAFYQSDLEKGLSALNQAYRLERPVEARISTLDYGTIWIYAQWQT